MRWVTVVWKIRRSLAGLVKTLQDRETHGWAILALGKLGPAVRSATAELEADLQNEDLRVRLQAATALWAVSHDVDKVLPIACAIAANDQVVTVGGYAATTRIVDGRRIEERHPYRTPLAVRAVELLGEMGPAAKSAARVLETLLKHPNREVQQAAARALAKIEPLADDGLPALSPSRRPQMRPSVRRRPHGKPTPPRGTAQL